MCLRLLLRKWHVRIAIAVAPVTLRLLGALPTRRVDALCGAFGLSALGCRHWSGVQVPAMILT